MKLLIQLRADARAAKDFATADTIRNGLTDDRHHPRRPRRRHGMDQSSSIGYAPCVP